MTENATCPRVLGCDVGKDTIVIFDSLTGTTQTVDSTVKALKHVLARFERDTFVVCEATGGYETALLMTAFSLELPVHRGDPRKTSAFLRSLRGHGKTDTLDARGLTRYGQERQAELPRWRPPRPWHRRPCVSWCVCVPIWWLIAPAICAASKLPDPASINAISVA